MSKIKFNNTLIKKRVVTALSFVSAHTSPDKQRQITEKEISKHLGRSNNRLGAYLRSKLIICTDPTYSKDAGRAKQYIRNDEGCQAVCKIYGINYDPTLSGIVFADLKFGDKVASNKLYYREANCGRYTNPLQNMRNEVRAPFCAAYNFEHNYDIDACAATLIYQLSHNSQSRALVNPHLTKEHIKQIEKAKKRPLTYILQSIEDKKNIREMLSRDLNIKVKDIKTALTAQLAGGSTTGKQSIYNILGNSTTKVEAYKNHPWIKEYSKDLTALWTPIRIVRGISSSMKAKQKWTVYYELERLVMDAVYSYLETQNIYPLKEHDGFRTRKIVDIAELETFITRKTNYKVTFKHEQVLPYADKKTIKSERKSLLL